MIIYSILIAATKVGVIWVQNKIVKKILLTGTQVLILMVIVEINRNKNGKKQKNYKNEISE